MENRKKILIIDDEEDVITYLTALFAYNNFYVISAPNGREGVQKAQTEKPDIITLDISMPEESGVKALRELQNSIDTKNIPIIIITGVAADLKRFIKSHKQIGMPKGFFEKPVDREALLKKINELLEI